jgi:hypothetical protein
MALQVCHECGAKVSSQAASCPHCGAPVRQLSQDIPAAQPPVTRKRKSRKGLLILFAIFALLVYLAVHNNSPQNVTRPADANASPSSADNQAPVPAPPSTATADAEASSPCKDDWQKCSDNADLVNHYKQYILLKGDCERAADKSARYGSPIWPGFWSGGSFAQFRAGSDAIRTGVFEAFEPDAQFSNAFGAMVHSTVTCKYDLRENRVLSISVVPNG